MTITELNPIESWCYRDKVNIFMKTFTSELEDNEIHKLWLKYINPATWRKLYNSVYCIETNLIIDDEIVL